METAVIEVHPSTIQTTQQSPFELAQNFLAAGGSLESLEKMMGLQERFNAGQAKKAFVEAMAEFKKHPIIIKKDKENRQYNSRYSSLAAFLEPCLPIMGQCGLSHKWEFEQTDPKSMTGTCTVTHSAGHSDSVSMTCPVDTSGQKNPIQQIKSTRTYIKIETFASVMGLASSEDLDDDGNASNIEYINEKQQSQIIDMINGFEEINEAGFLKYMGVESVELIPAKDFSRAMVALKKKAGVA